MSTRFEKKIIMPAGTMGRTTLLDLSDDDRKSVERWHRKEWDEFRIELVAYKHKILDAVRDTYLWNRDNCIACKKARMFSNRLRKYQRGSIMLGAAGVSGSAHILFDGDCTFTTSTIPNLTEFNIEPTNSYTQARLHSDGDWYSNTSTNGAWGTTDGTWQGSCAIADYDAQWNLVSGTAPNANTSGTDGVWQAASTSTAVGYNSNFGVDSGSFNLKLRDGTSLNELFTDSFTMTAEVDARN